MSLPVDRMARAKVAGQIIEPIPLSRAPSEFSDDAQSDWVAADTGQMFTQKVGGSAEVTGRPPCGPLRCDGVPSSSAGRS